MFPTERVPPQVEIHGTGIEAKIYKGISSIMQKKKLNINFKHCIPKPKSPNFYSYTHIGRSHMVVNYAYYDSGSILISKNGTGKSIIFLLCLLFFSVIYTTYLYTL